MELVARMMVNRWMYAFVENVTWVAPKFGPDRKAVSFPQVLFCFFGIVPRLFQLKGSDNSMSLSLVQREISALNSIRHKYTRSYSWTKMCIFLGPYDEISYRNKLKKLNVYVVSSRAYHKIIFKTEQNRHY